MVIETKTLKGIQLIPTETRLLTKRCVFIAGTISDELALDVMKQVMYLLDEDAASPINLFISTPGGTINDGLMLYDLITGITDTVIRTICVGKACSMGAVLLAAGHAGNRYILPNSEVMIHEPLISGGIGGSSSSIKSISDSLQDTRALINGILAHHTKKTMKQIEKATSYDHYFTAREAVAFGLADYIVTFNEIVRGEYSHEE